MGAGNQFVSGAAAYNPMTGCAGRHCLMLVHASIIYCVERSSYGYQSDPEQRAWYEGLIRGLAKFHNDRLGSMPEPVQVIWGTEDDIFPMKDQELVRKKLSRCNATFIPMEGASHNGFWDSLRSCRAYAEQILRFTQGERYFTGKS